jgi:hypothetical protein
MILLYLTAISFSLLGQVEPEADWLLRPTPVKLDYADQPVGEVVRSLAERTGVPMVLYPDEPTASWRKKRISLTAPEPVPFWAAIDRLEPSAGLILDEWHGARELRLRSDRGTLGPVSYDRVFRCRLASVNDERERIYGDPGFQLHSSFRRASGRRDARDPGSLWERFFVQLEVMAEPRPMTSLEPAGPPRIIEALDDQGRSLILEAGVKPIDEYPRKYYDKEWYAGFDANLYLKTPDPASRSIRRLKGAVPIVMWGHRAQALMVPLAGSEGRTFKGAGVSLEILKLTTSGPAPSLDLALRADSPAPPEDPRYPLFDTYPGLVVRRYDEQFEVLDAAGTRLPFDGRSSEFDPAVTRATIRLKPGHPGGPPDRLRFHGLVRIETEVSFEFADVPLP